MATDYGNQVHHWQAYVEASVTSETSTTATITCKTYWHSIAWGYSYYGHGYGVIGSTTGSDSGTVVFSSGTGASVYQLLTTMTKEITKTSSAQSITCKGVAILTGDSTGTRNGTSTATVTVTVPAIAYESPNAPSNCSASRVSDTNVSVTWTNGSVTTLRPRTATLVERSTNGGSWTQIASVGSSVTNYSDKTSKANCRYSYRVKAKNTAGSSSYSTYSYVYTTPAAPTAVKAEVTSATQVRVSATVSAPYATGYDVQASWDGGSWATKASNASLPYTDTVSGATVKYRVRSVRGTLASAWKESASVVTQTTPNAPTVTVSPAGVVELGVTVTVRWSPNHPDGSAQTAATVKVTDPGGTASTTSLTTETEWQFAPSSEGSWSVEVRTQGIAAEGYGPYSSTQSVSAYAAPAIVITSPATDGEQVTTLPLTVAWSVTDSTGVSSQTVAITDTDTGVVLYSSSPATSTTSLSLSASDMPTIANGVTYEVSVLASGGSGLSSSALRTFVTDWALPATPTLFVENDPEALSVSVAAFAGVGDGTEPATASLVLARMDADGNLWTIGTGLADGDTLVDPLPPLGVEYSYVATAVTAMGTTASATMTNVIETRAWALNFGDAAQDVMALAYNPQASYSLAQGGESYHFADGGAGGGRPVWYGTSDRDESGSLKFGTIMQGDFDRLRGLCDAHPVAWLRDPFGHRWRAQVRPSVSHGVGQLWPVSVSWDADRFREAW